MWKMVLILDSKVAKVLDINEKIFSYKYLMWKMVLILDSKVAKVLDINEKIKNLRLQHTRPWVETESLQWHFYCHWLDITTEDPYYSWDWIFNNGDPACEILYAQLCLSSCQLLCLSVCRLPVYLSACETAWLRFCLVFLSACLSFF